MTIGQNHWNSRVNSLNLLTKFNEIADQIQWICKTAHYPFDCHVLASTLFCSSRNCDGDTPYWHLKAVQKWLWCSHEKCQAVEIRHARITVFFSCRKSLLVVSWWSNEGLLWSVDGLFVVETWSKRVKIKSSATGYVSVSLLVRQCLWSGGRFLRHRVCACAHAHARGVWG